MSKGVPMSPEHRAKMAAGKEPARAAKAAAAGSQDPDLVSERLANELRGIKEPEAAPRPTAYVDPGADPDLVSAAESVRILEETLKRERAALAQRVANRGESIHGQDKGRIPVELLAFQTPKMPDPLEPIDDSDPDPDKHHVLGTPGYVRRWVRVKESVNDTGDNTFRLRTFQAWGAKILKKANGDPVRTQTMICVEMPPEQNARRIIHHAPTGVYDTARPMDRLRNAAEEINRDYSRRHDGAPGGVLNVERGDVTTTHERVNPFAPAD